ncbi:MAG: hypothetical protein ACJAVY_000616, partial [Marinoscillum sp.]
DLFDVAFLMQKTLFCHRHQGYCQIPELKRKLTALHHRYTP